MKRSRNFNLGCALMATAGLLLTTGAEAAKEKKKVDRRMAVVDLKTPPAAVPPSTEKIKVKATAAQIDALVEKKLAEEKLQPNAMASDEVFLRRIYLDVIGRVPTKTEALAFLESKEPEKRSKLINSLLNSEGYTQNFFNYWADVLRVKNGILPGGQGAAAGAAYIEWLKKSLQQNKPYDQMVREMLTADGASYEDGAIGFYMRDYNMPLDNMAVTMQVFLGTQMVCAQCHNHPFDKWTQKDYYEIAAHSYGMTGSNALATQADVAKAMTKLGVKPEEKKDIGKALNEILFQLRFNHVFALDKALKLPQDYQYKDAAPLAAVAPVIPASFSKDGKIAKEGQAPVLPYAQWMTSKKNPRFTLVAANRLWKKVMGMGVIDPVDEITDSTVPSNPALMEFLEKTLKDVNYDMKAYLRVLFNTSTYQRESYTQDVELGAVYHFPGPLLRRMSAEQIWDSIVALGKDNPDEPSAATQLETQQLLTKVEWMDRTINVLSPEEIIDGARHIASYQKELSRDVQAKTAALKDNNDEAAVKEAKQAAKNQRAKIYEEVENYVCNNGLRKYAGKIAVDPAAVIKETDKQFVAQVSAAVKKFGKVPTYDEALDFVRQQNREAFAASQEAAREQAMKQWGVVTPENKASYKKLIDFSDKFFVRAADLKHPAPNGHFLRVYGQSDRELVENSNKEASVMQALTMMNGSLFRNLTNPYSVVSRELKKAKTIDEMIDTIYLSTLSRSATEEEKAMLRPVMETSKAEGRGDVLWTVLNTRQFLFIQ